MGSPFLFVNADIKFSKLLSVLLFLVVFSPLVVRLILFT